MTVGVEFLTRTISIQDETIKLQIWDTVNLHKIFEKIKK